MTRKLSLTAIAAASMLAGCNDYVAPETPVPEVPAFYVPADQRVSTDSMHHIIVQRRTDLDVDLGTGPISHGYELEVTTDVPTQCKALGGWNYSNKIVPTPLTDAAIVNMDKHLSGNYSYRLGFDPIPQSDLPFLNHHTLTGIVPYPNTAVALLCRDQDLKYLKAPNGGLWFHASQP